jgi:hypothetical protein
VIFRRHRSGLRAPARDGTLNPSSQLSRQPHQTEEPDRFVFDFPKEHPMKMQTLVLASMAVFALAGSANAGPCATEIDSVAKTLAAKDAGSGPTGSVTGGMKSAATSARQNPTTSIMKQQTEGKATSPEDVRRQTAGQPTAAQQGPAMTGSMQASDALNRARTLDQQGKEAECMAAVREARQLAGQP